MAVNADYFHGIRVHNRSDVMYSPSRTTYTPLGLVVTGDEADAALFPEGETVLLRSYGAATQSKVGSTGTLKNSLDLINSMGFFPPVIVVRVAEKVDADEQASVVANAIQALKTASAKYEVEPKIIGCPGLDAHPDVITALESVTTILEAFAYVALPAANAEEAETLMQNYSHRRMMAIWPDFSKSGTPVSAVALALGMRSYIDATIGPHKTLSNVAIPSKAIDGISSMVDWQTPDSLGNTLNKAHVTTLIRRDGHFYFWGNRTCYSGELTWSYESDVRMADVLNGIIKSNQFDDVDHPMTRAMIEDRLAQINSDIDIVVKRGWLVAGAAWINPAQNDQDVLSSGGLWVDYEFTVPKPLEQLGLNSKITNKYLLRVLPDWVTAE